MRAYTITIELENDAFQASGDHNPEEAAAVEVGRILDEIGEHINTYGALPITALQDINGNRCGQASGDTHGAPA